MKRWVLATVVVVLGLGARAYAYPQFQLSRDQTCTACHIAPEGGGLLNENGLATSESISQFGTAPEFLNGAVKTPAWLTVGGDFRGNWGYSRAPQQYLLFFPMQADLLASAKVADHFHINLGVGYRPPEYGNENATRVWSREHYIMWQQKPDANDGLYVRVGRFMPVFGLRFVEHPFYVRRYGGTALYTETYGAAISYVTPKYEGHVTAFIRDPVIDPVAHDDGAAGYAEYRVSDVAQIGAEGMVTVSPDDKKYRGGVTGKYYVKSSDLLIEAEGQVVNQHIGGFGLVQLVGQILVTKFLANGFMVDVGLGHYDENIRIKGLDRDALDVNVHWFTTSHIELLLTTRLELINQGAKTGTDIGGPTGAYAFLQAHYRL